MDQVTHWLKVRAPILALLLTVLVYVISTYERLSTVETQLRDTQVQEQMIWAAVGRIETRLMVVR